MPRTPWAPSSARLATSFVLIPWIGSSHSEQVIIIASALSALLMLEPSFAGAGERQSGWNLTGTAVLAMAMVAAGLLARSVHQLPGLLVAYGRYAATRVGQASIIYVGEGLNASVAVSELSNGVRNYHNAGKVQASSEPQDMRLQRMLGHLTTLIPSTRDKVLVIGCGAGGDRRGVSTESDRSRHETIAESSRSSPRSSPRTQPAQLRRHPQSEGARRIDDARHFVETTTGEVRWR